jgi:putative acyl-CoA dehydrogenase
MSKMSHSGFVRSFGETHDVVNQPPPFADVNLYTSDRALCSAVEREGGSWSSRALEAFGGLMGSSRVLELGRQANRYSPELRTHDRFGHRLDEVEYHPAWHEVMRIQLEHEVHNLPWRNRRPGAHVARLAKHYILSQVEAGSACPITMTFASLPALQHEPRVAEEWKPRLLGTVYDPRFVPAGEKSAVLIGMAMTEKQGGSDVRANTTEAIPLGDGDYGLIGHKWFCSAPMCDAFLTLAHADKGLTCFLVPRWRPDGTRNSFRIQRLKDKVGNRSNASAEIEYSGTWARRVGEEGRGVRTIIEMVHHTRLDCISGSAGIMRQALAQALHHAQHRSAFGRRLIEQPLMRTVAADLALEVEGAVALLFRLARAYDHSAESETERAFARIGTAVAKYWVCKRTPGMVYESMECLGGNGYVEESLLPRLYREAPVNAIWEGSGNVICLDVLRAISREPGSLEALLAEIRAGADPRLEACSERITKQLAAGDGVELVARRIVGEMARGLQGSLLARTAPSAIAEAYLAARCCGDSGFVFGELPRAIDFRTILDRAVPALG